MPDRCDRCDRPLATTETWPNEEMCFWLAAAYARRGQRYDSIAREATKNCESHAVEWRTRAKAADARGNALRVAVASYIGLPGCDYAALKAALKEYDDAK